MSTIKLLVTGYKGRMGQAIIDCASRDDQVEVAAQIDIGDSLADALPLCDTIIDFTHHSFTTELVSAAADAGKNLVIGTTGHTAEELAVIQDASAKTGIVMAPNFSIGVNTLFWLTAKAAATLGPDFDLEVVEMHHNQKTDAPSGTAKRLAEILADARNLSYDKDTRHGRQGDVGARTQNEIGVHSLRGGDVVGDHTVVLATDGERIELTHRASNRNTFAGGAVRSARWLASQPAGLYDMQDVLNLKD
ncbi:MAG: 4-hydroxy-tetrahydrodipicolinate reductase [Verrucomicrobiota bacterium]